MDQALKVDLMSANNVDEALKILAKHYKLEECTLSTFYKHILINNLDLFINVLI